MKRRKLPWSPGIEFIGISFQIISMTLVFILIHQVDGIVNSSNDVIKESESVHLGPITCDLNVDRLNILEISLEKFLFEEIEQSLTINGNSSNLIELKIQIISYSTMKKKRQNPESHVRIRKRKKEKDISHRKTKQRIHSPVQKNHTDLDNDSESTHHRYQFDFIIIQSLNQNSSSLQNFRTIIEDSIKRNYQTLTYIIQEEEKLLVYNSSDYCFQSLQPLPQILHVNSNTSGSNTNGNMISAIVEQEPEQISPRLKFAYFLFSLASFLSIILLFITKSLVQNDSAQIPTIVQTEPKHLSGNDHESDLTELVNKPVSVIHQSTFESNFSSITVSDPILKDSYIKRHTGEYEDENKSNKMCNNRKGSGRTNNDTESHQSSSSKTLKRQNSHNPVTPWSYDSSNPDLSKVLNTIDDEESVVSTSTPSDRWNSFAVYDEKLRRLEALKKESEEAVKMNEVNIHNNNKKLSNNDLFNAIDSSSNILDNRKNINVDEVSKMNEFDVHKIIDENVDTNHIDGYTKINSEEDLFGSDYFNGVFVDILPEPKYPEKVDIKIVSDRISKNLAEKQLPRTENVSKIGDTSMSQFGLKIIPEEEEENEGQTSSESEFSSVFENEQHETSARSSNDQNQNEITNTDLSFETESNYDMVDMCCYGNPLNNPDFVHNKTSLAEQDCLKEKQYSWNFSENSSEPSIGYVSDHESDVDTKSDSFDTISLESDQSNLIPDSDQYSEDETSQTNDGIESSSEANDSTEQSNLNIGLKVERRTSNTTSYEFEKKPWQDSMLKLSYKWDPNSIDSKSKNWTYSSEEETFSSEELSLSDESKSTSLTTEESRLNGIFHITKASSSASSSAVQVMTEEDINSTSANTAIARPRVPRFDSDFFLKYGTAEERRKYREAEEELFSNQERSKFDVMKLQVAEDVEMEGLEEENAQRKLEKIRSRIS